MIKVAFEHAVRAQKLVTRKFNNAFLTTQLSAIFAITLVLVSLTPNTAYAAQDAKPYQLTIVDSSGKPAANVKVIIHELDISLETDANGQVTLPEISQGIYRLDVEAKGLGHFNIDVELAENVSVNVELDEDNTEHMVVSANPLEHSAQGSVMPVDVVSADELRKQMAANLAATISQQSGVHASSFGAGAGKPVVRGQSGNRVRMMQGGTGVLDVSGTGPDHNIASEPLLADSVEILRGPATLLFGTTASGGAINVVDGRIPDYVPETSEYAVETRASSADSGKAAVFRADMGKDDLAFHISGFSRNAGDYDTPTFELEEENHEAHEGEEEHEDEHEGEHEEHETANSVENSFTKGKGLTLGTSYLANDDLIGFAIGYTESQYGLPGHAHHDEHDEEGEEGHEDEHEEEHGHEEEALPYVDMQQTRYDLKGKWAEPFKGFESMQLAYSYNDYKHQEIEGGEVSTEFKNKGSEFRAELAHDHLGPIHGIIGIQATKRDFSAIGEEAYVSPSVTKNTGLFLLEELDWNKWHAEFGARYEKQDTSTKADLPDYNSSGTSASFGLSYKLNKNYVLKGYYTNSTRMPSAEELYADGFHVATRAYEVGLLTALHHEEEGEHEEEPGHEEEHKVRNERAKNLDVAFLANWENLSLNVNLFKNDIANYIYLAPEHDEEQGGEEHEGEEGGDEHAHENHMLYTQQDAKFIGAEFEIKHKKEFSNNDRLTTSFGADYVRAELTNGGYLPRQSPKRAHLKFNYLSSNWDAELSWMRVFEQKHTASDEAHTDGYNHVNASFNYYMNWSENIDASIFLHINNLTDELQYDHTSYIKNVTPRMGRNLTLGLRVGL